MATASAIFVNLNRLSFFTKWNLERENGKVFFPSLANIIPRAAETGGGVYEGWRLAPLQGSDELYGESIYTRRELFGTYELPLEMPLKLDYSLSCHYQDSYCR